MFETFAEIRTGVRSDLSVSENSSLYPTATIDRAINRAYVKVSRLFRWPALEDAKYTTTQSGIDYYDAPETWIPDSMWRLSVGGVMYGEDPDGSPMAFADYLKWKQDYPTSTEKKWATQWLRFFITPAPTDSATQICAWGLKNVTKLTSDSHETFFSKSMPECNEAIALEAVAILKKKGADKEKGNMYSEEAKQILASAYDHSRKSQAKYKRNLPYFDVPNFYQGNGAPQVTGNFTNTRSIGF